ncbi:MAG: RT0821/Lpp0805 family surface protein [Hyphomicrobiaceae bacterium]
MRQSSNVGHDFAPLLCGIASAVFLAGLVFLGPGAALAQDGAQTQTQAPPPGDSAQSCTCPSDRKPDSQKLWPRPKLADAKPEFDQRDELATLEAVHVALSEVGDGSTYVWHRPGGALSGVVQPTASFKDASGKICRHIVISLSAGAITRKTEGVACRLATGVWQLDG